MDVSPMVFNIGVRYLNQSPISSPAIIYDKDFLATLNEIELNFTIQHEAYHFSSGDAYHAYKYFDDHGRYQSRGEL